MVLPRIFVVVLVSLVSLDGTSASQPPTSQPPESCTDCHKRMQSRSGEATYEETVATSVHEDLDCIDCHASASLDSLDLDADNPHTTPMTVVECADCHDDIAEVYLQHGRAEVGADKHIPTCRSCHGTHAILPYTDPLSITHRSNASKPCLVCHSDEEIMGQYPHLNPGHIDLYVSSVHGQLAGDSGTPRATCIDCHAANDDDGEHSSHIILNAGHPGSATNNFVVSDTCGRCHGDVNVKFWQGVHGSMAKLGDTLAPTCTKCHGEHRIEATDSSLSSVNAANLAIHICTRCHESDILNERAGRTAAQQRSYVDPYHGLKRKSGRVHVANCVSCHGIHDMFATSDPRSPVHPDNIQATCLECHPGMSAARASISIHDAPTADKEGWPYLIAVIYLILIVFTISLMLLHNIGHWVRHARNMRGVKHVIRMSTNEVLQHWVLMISFVVLVMSGFALRFNEAFWVDWLFGWGSGEGFLTRGPVHRVAAVVFMIWTVWHIIYLCTRPGRAMMREMIWSWKDFGRIKQSALFFLGKRKEPARFGRFSYMEKCEYWALLWGTVIMIITGIPLWFEDHFIETWGMSLLVRDCLQVIHYFEAWLATLAIFVWHIYDVLFNPSVYPMNPAWLSGKMPAEMYEHEHPEGPKLEHHGPTAPGDED
ncbi:MAG: cytochrome b/b6 domain-containing protein [Planctomycetota bacterium]|jgi:cytochrome b subunit of formate dehydrogenase